MQWFGFYQPPRSAEGTYRNEHAHRRHQRRCGGERGAYRGDRTEVRRISADARACEANRCGRRADAASCGCRDNDDVAAGAVSQPRAIGEMTRSLGVTPNAKRGWRRDLMKCDVGGITAGNAQVGNAQVGPAPRALLDGWFAAALPSNRHDRCIFPGAEGGSATLRFRLIPDAGQQSRAGVVRWKMRHQLSLAARPFTTPGIENLHCSCATRALLCCRQLLLITRSLSSR